MTTRTPVAITRHEIDELGPWFHNLHLPEGVQTAPDHELGDFPAFKWEDLGRALPRDLGGWTALDVGCNAGYYSFELARRGARVTGVDVDEHYLAQARWARQRFGFDDGRVQFRQAQVYELASWEERFDLVLFLGVFYHLRYPVLALDAVARLARRLLLFQSLSMAPAGPGAAPADGPLSDRDAFLAHDWPKMALVERRFAGDPTNWWIPNGPCVDALLRVAGLEVVDRPHHEAYLCRPAASPDRVLPAGRLEAEFRAAAGLDRRRSGNRDARHDGGAG